MSTPLMPISLPYPMKWDLARTPSALSSFEQDQDMPLQLRRLSRIPRNRVGVEWMFTGVQCKVFTDFGRDTLLNWHRKFKMPTPEGSSYVGRIVQFVERPQIQLAGYNLVRVTGVVQVLDASVQFGIGCAEDGFSVQQATLDLEYAGVSGTTIVGGDNGFVAMGRIGDNVTYVHTSSDALTWTRRIFPSGSTVDARNLHHVAGNTWIIPLGNAFPNAFTMRSTDNGATWSYVAHNDGSTLYPYGNAVSDDGSVIRYTVYLSTATRVSFDQGASFSAGPNMPASVYNRGLTYHAGKWYAVNLTNNNVYVLDEASQIWSIWDQLTSFNLVPLMSAGGLLFAVRDSNGDIYVSEDDGVSFTPATGDVATWQTQRRSNFLYHPDGFWFTTSHAGGTAPGKVHASRNGIEWSTMPIEVPLPLYPTSMAASGISGNVVAMGSVRDTDISMFRLTC